MTNDAQLTMETSNIFIPTSTTTTVRNPSAVTTPESASTQQADWAKQVAESVGFTNADSKMQDFISRVSKEKLREACNPAPVGCTIGSSGAAKSVALFGDSHAYMFASTVATMLPDWLIRDYSTGSCIAASIDFANNKQEQMGGTTLQECINSRNSAIEDIVARPPDLVIISDRTSWVVDDKQTTAWEVGERETYDRLSSISTKTKVVRFGETPSVETRWDRCLTASGSIKTCFGSRGDIAEALTNVQSVAKRYPWVQFVDVSTWLCSGDTCPPVINGIPAYIDNSHLSLEFRPLLAPLLKEAINI